MAGEGVDRDADLKTWIRQAIEFVSALDREVLATPHGVSTMPARKTDKTSEPAARKPARPPDAPRHAAAGGKDGPGRPRESSGRRKAGLCLHRRPSPAAARYRRTCRCPGGRAPTRPAALREMGQL